MLLLYLPNDRRTYSIESSTESLHNCKGEIMTKKGLDKRFNAEGVEGHWTNNSVAGAMAIDLLNVRDSTLVGAIGELIAWKNLNRKGISVYRFGSIYFSGIHEKQADFSDFFSRNLKWFNNQQVNYLKNIDRYETRRWDFIGCRYRYRSRYGRRRIEQASFELRAAQSKKEEKEIQVKEEELEKLQKKFRIREFYLIEVKTTQDRTRRGKFKGKMQTNIPYAKSLGFKPLLMIVEFLDNWRFQVTCEEL